MGDGGGGVIEDGGAINKPSEFLHGGEEFDVLVFAGDVARGPNVHKDDVKRTRGGGRLDGEFLTRRGRWH